MKKELFTSKNCVRDMYDSSVKTNVDCIAIIKADWFKPEYRTAENQLVRLQGGFGVVPTSTGNACFVRFCNDGEEVRLERYDFIGIADEETTKYAEGLERNINS